MSTPVFPGATVTANSGTLGQVLTIYRLSPAARAFDTPNLLSSRFENVTTALGAAFAALPIGTVLFEDSVAYTYDGANEDVEILTPGLYAIEASVQVERAGANPVVSVAVHKNGALLAAGVVSSHALTNTTAQAMLSCASVAVQLAATDKISIRGLVSGGGGAAANCTAAFLKITKLRITT